LKNIWLATISAGEGKTGNLRRGGKASAKGSVRGGHGLGGGTPRGEDGGRVKRGRE